MMQARIHRRVGGNLNDHNVGMPSRDSVRSHIMSSHRPHCNVWGALAFTLHVSRFVGVAPLKLIRNSKDRWQISFSSNLYVYSCALLIFLHLGIITGLIMDLNQEEERSVRVRDLTSRATWIVLLLIVCSTATVGVSEAPTRVKRTIKYLNIVENIHFTTGNGFAKTVGQKKRYFMALACLLANITQSISDFYLYLDEAITAGKELRIVFSYSCFYVEFLMTLLLELQFIFEALLINSAIQSVNHSLTDLIYVLDLQILPKLSSVMIDDLNYQYSDIGEIMIDSDLPKKGTIESPLITKRAQETVRRLLLSFGALCDVVRQVNKNYGKVLLLLIGSFFLHLVITPYYLVALLYAKGSGFDLFLQGFYSILHTFYLLIMVDPGHKLELEVERTHMLVSQLLRRVTSPQDPLALELDLFCKQIELNKVAFTPLGVCTLTRPLVASIFGGVTTYLVIMLQFQTLDKQSNVPPT